MRVLVLLLLLVASSVQAYDYAKDSNVVELSDETFEHDTQAASGATTGDWFVMFYAPWCGHCKRLKPTWFELADELKGSVNVAQVDATQHTYSAARFEIRGYPSLRFLSRGMAYEYSGPRTVEALKSFAEGGYEDVEAVKISPPMGMKDVITAELSRAWEDIQKLYASKPEAVGVIFSAGLLAGVVGAMIIFLMFIPHPEKKNNKPKKSTKQQ